MSFNSSAELNSDSKLADLQNYNLVIDKKTDVETAVKLLKENLKIPGIIVTKNGLYFGMISRLKLFEILGHRFGQELFLTKSLKYLLKEGDIPEALVFNYDESIADATYKTLSRSFDLIYEPVVVVFPENQYRLIDTHSLLYAQSQIHLHTVQKLEQANEFKSEVLRIAAHDLKNPLNNIMGYSSLLNSEFNDDETIQSISNSIYSSSERMVDLITNLLSSDATETGKLKIEKKVNDINNIIADVIENNNRNADIKNQNIKFNKSDSSCLCLIDCLKIFEVVDNLVSNAIKFSKFDANIEIKLIQLDGEVKICVYDEGPGLTDDDFNNIFGKFQRLSAKPTANENSTGLGLYIAKQIVELHNGKIWVENRKDFGAKFCFTLPLYEKSTEEIACAR